MHKLNTNERLTNMDVVRDTLFCIDRVCKYYTDRHGRFVPHPKKRCCLIYGDASLRNKYSQDEIKSCIIELEESKMIITSGKRKIGCNLPAFICGLTWDGDQFVSNIQNDEIWWEVKRRFVFAN